jgi:hypothetical protein
MSIGNFQGTVPSLPIPRFSVAATTNVSGFLTISMQCEKRFTNFRNAFLSLKSSPSDLCELFLRASRVTFFCQIFWFTMDDEEREKAALESMTAYFVDQLTL